ncbi:hypothetical protein H0H92_004266 [Tricholoma furcatifolium]|nr:hypothetical protein H0H92_004266 [Tricholoma furcatifolium]
MDMATDCPPSETTALLASSEPALVYQRFSRRSKWIIVILVSFCGLMPLFVSGAFVPSIPQIAKDLNTTGAISYDLLTLEFADGRRTIYLIMLPFLCIGSLGVAQSRSVLELMIWRFVQAFGASPGLSIGAGVIGDIYPLEERGQAMGIFFSACLLGPALAPPVGGFFTSYSTWRVMQLVLGAFGCSILLAISIFLPDTSHPGSRGVDKVPEGQSKLVFVNPLKPLALLRSPNLFLVSLSGFFVLWTDYGLLTEYVPGMIGLILNLVCLFVHGIGVDIALSPSSAYAVDILHSRSAEAMAATMSYIPQGIPDLVVDYTVRDTASGLR